MQIKTKHVNAIKPMYYRPVNIFTPKRFHKPSDAIQDADLPQCDFRIYYTAGFLV